MLRINKAIVCFLDCPNCLLNWKQRRRRKKMMVWQTAVSLNPSPVLLSVLHCSEWTALLFDEEHHSELNAQEPAGLGDISGQETKRGRHKLKKKKSQHVTERRSGSDRDVDISQAFCLLVLVSSITLECDGGRGKCSHAPHKSDFFKDNHSQCSGTDITLIGILISCFTGESWILGIHRDYIYSYCSQWKVYYSD